jgi:hypothetical protein
MDITRFTHAHSFDTMLLQEQLLEKCYNYKSTLKLKEKTIIITLVIHFDTFMQ